MRKMRHKKWLVHENWKQFTWIRVIKQIANFFPSVKETYYLNFSFTSKVGDSERKRVEDLVYDFYDVNKGKHQVVFCWRETEAIVLVF